MLQKNYKISRTVKKRHSFMYGVMVLWVNIASYDLHFDPVLDPAE